MKRVIAVDWSGAKAGAVLKIWLAEVCGGRIKRPESGRKRRELVEHLIDEAARDADLVVGLDFAFSFPRWFAERSGWPQHTRAAATTSKPAAHPQSDCPVLRHW